MQHFRTILAKQDFPFGISYSDHILSMGSCFATHMGQKLEEIKFNCLLNPFGILFNPISIVQSLHYLMEGKQYQENDLFLDHQLWHSFDFHGQFSATTAESSLQKMNKSIVEASSFLKKTNRLILTLGTAYAWRHLQTDQIVANCHKVPSSAFERECLSVDQIVGNLGQAMKAMQKICPELKCLITVSPVRHIRDGLVNNQKSKAILLLAAHELTEKFKFVHYFPAYELLMDDLRDYRFYKADLIHPTELGIDYIWEYFKECLFSFSTQASAKSIGKIIQAVQHRPLFPNSDGHHHFVQATLKKIEQAEKEFPAVSFESKKTLLRGGLK